ncbi:hypothetical protein K469DRAFT_692140 [Zopfia rhizophila CBS 207.26]|uniref:MADS-box domain-containing protein n=1 Tax=Zopfia rhizophila CBS 207.26 TaxID=1314779 RepID=A0A6A6DQI7_9PEZI|nr:hypothetical protein K469DRAFT_692140 [Zopfia rhizophila CBS 207.26]
MARGRAKNTAKESLTAKRRKRGQSLFHKAYEYESLCQMQVALFLRNPDNNQVCMYIPGNGIVWYPSEGQIQNMQPPPRRMLGHDLEGEMNRPRLEPTVRKSIIKDGTANTKTIDLTSLLPEPPPFNPIQRDYIQEEQAEIPIRIKEEEDK